MENAFETDFSHVTVQRNSATAERLGAIAYTQGDEIHFAPGYNPYTSSGQEYLGHELTHVLQQQRGRVSTTHQEQGYNVNSDVGLETEADLAGERAAKGQKVRAEVETSNDSKKPPVQKKNAPIQLRRPLPSGAPIFDLRINPNTVLDAFDRAHNAVMRSTTFGGGGTSISSHPVLASQIRTICGGNYFRGNNFWASDWEDEGWNDIADFGIADVDVKAEMTMYIENEQVVHTGTGEHTAGGTSGQTSTQSRSTTIGGSLEGTVGGHEGAPGATAGVSAQTTTGSSSTISSTGSGGLKMDLPSEARRADVLIECKVLADPTLGGIRYRYWTAQGPDMQVIFGGVGNTVR